ncbi:hypothetical protein PG997_011926 [Apiospora hydei]|uniref:Uncharacterized protein n=1 Tax=Apiospora hydei TaxID=1337664 RepID=A0ABR1V554_9PEZI
MAPEKSSIGTASALVATYFTETTDMDFELDPAIIAALPAGAEIIAVDPHGNTNWSNGFRVAVVIGDEKEEFFLKIINREDAIEMAIGQYESQKALIQYLPDNISPPLAHGALELNPDSAFFLTKFHKLHLVFPTGKFGFPVTTFKGYVAVDNEWTDTWEEFFDRQFKKEIAWEQTVRGEDAEMEHLAEEFFDKVIPRLLRPL